MRPVKAEIDYMFICRKCGAPGWMTHKEASIYGHWICGCGEVHKIEPPTSVVFKFASDTKAIIKKVPTPSKVQNNIPTTSKVHNHIPIDDFIKTLTGLGYKRIEAKKMVLDKIGRDGYNGNVEEFAAQLVMELKCH